MILCARAIGRSTLNKILLTIFACTAIITALFAQEPNPLPPAPDKDPFVGTWQANQNKSTPALTERGASYARRITRDGKDLVFSSLVGTSKPRYSEYRIRCDGLFHSTPFGSLSCRYTSPNRVEGETILKTHETEFWAREVSADGQEMRISAYSDNRRTKLKSESVLDRVK